jgi:predicted ATPase/DNA-binding CsgD family transcriptional regulator
LLAGLAQPERVSQLCHPELPAVVAELPRTTSLPAWPTPLVGREQERRDVATVLAESRLVTITGAGGSGKTRLAHAVAQDLAGRFTDGVVWVELARLSSGELVAGAVLTACGVREAPGVSVLDSLVHSLAQREILIVLDNCEHLLAACAALADAVVRRAADVRMIATSREPLGVGGETCWRIPSLRLPDQDERDPEHIANADAVRLFVARARAARPEFQLDAASAPIVVRICRRLDGIPLALELAAARVRTLSIDRLAAGLDDRFRLLTGGARTATARQRTLLASVEWSHDLLDEEERTLFRRLAVFAAPFGLEAAEAVVADGELDCLGVFDLLARLVDKSLVQHAGDGYRLLETLRQYALERADDAGELAELRDRHLAWFRRRASGWRLDREYATHAVLTEIAAEVPDLIAALDWSLGREEGVALELLFPLDQHWGFRDALGELRTVAGRVLGAQAAGSREWLDALAPFADSLVVARDVGWLPTARRALDTFGKDVDVITRGFVEYALGLSSTLEGRGEGIAALRGAVEAGRSVGSRKLEMLSTVNLAYFLCLFGDVASARPLLAWLDRHLPPECAVSFLHDAATATAAMHRGDFTVARRRLDQALGRNALLALLVQAGEIGFLSRDPAAVRDALTGLKARPGAWVLTELVVALGEGMLFLLSDDLEAAAGALDRVVEDAYFAERWPAVLRAEIDFSLGDLAGAARRVNEVEARLEGTELHLARARVDLLGAHLARARGDVGEAEAHAHQALVNAWAHEMSLVATDALETLALLEADRGAIAESARLLGAAKSFRERTGYRWQPVHHRRAIEGIRPTLASAALAEGAVLSLEEAVAYARRGRGERGRPDHGWESLTPTELRVVELVAEGLPNREVAKRLFVSPATVKSHLIHVFTKLDVRTRAELAAAATQRRLAHRVSKGGSSS